MKYAWITQHRDSYPIVLMCEAARRLEGGVLRLAVAASRALGPSGASGSTRRCARFTPSRRRFTAASRSPASWPVATIWSRPVATRWPGRCGKWA